MIIFAHNKFDIKNKGAWMAPFIRSALSVDNKLKGEKKVYFNHTANLIEHNGGWIVIEAGWNKEKRKAEVIQVSYEEWKKGREKGSFQVMDCPFWYNKSEYKKRLLESVGKPYDFSSVLIFQPIKLFMKIWFGSKSNKKFYCSKLSAYAFQLKDFYRIDPEELYNKIKI